MCPFSGQTQISSQTTNQIFERYLREGSTKNSIKPLKGLETSDSVNQIKGCSMRQHSGWWCLYYAIMLINYGRHEHFKGNITSRL